MDTILVTGSNGFVGQHLVRELLANNYAVVGIGGPDKLGNQSEQPNFSYMALDLSDPAAAHQIDYTKINGIIHLAGLANVGASFADPMAYIRTNIGIEVNLFEAALAVGTSPRFIIVSSGSLYDPTASVPLTENSPTGASSPYAVSKLGQEQMAIYYSQRGFNNIIARPFNHFGPGQGEGFIVPDLTKQVVAVKQGQADKVLVGNLDAKRDYTDVRDIAHAYRLLYEKGKEGQTYNICSGRPLSGHDVLAGILTASSSHPTIEVDQSRMRPSDNPEVYGNHDKLTTDTGWQPETELTTTFDDVVADWQSRSDS